MDQLLNWTLVWTVVGIIESILIGAYLSMLSMNPPQVKPARRSIWLAGVLLILITLAWARKKSPSTDLMAIVSAIFGVVGIGLPTAIIWSNREEFSKGYGKSSGHAKAALFLGFCMATVALSLNLPGFQPTSKLLAAGKTDAPHNDSSVVNSADIDNPTKIGTTKKPPDHPLSQKVSGKTQESAPTPQTEIARADPPQPEANPITVVPLIAILEPQVSHVYTRRQVSAQVASQMAAFFKTHNFTLASVPQGIQSFDDYVNAMRNSGTMHTGWAAQAMVELHPIYQRKTVAGSKSPSTPNEVLVNLSMTCSVIIKIVRLPLGDHPATAAGQSSVVRTTALTALTSTVRDYDFSRTAAESATANALARLPIN